MAIKAIVELRAKPGRRDEVKALLDSHEPSEPEYLGSTRYEVLDDPDLLIEIAEWESAEARLAWIKATASTSAYTQLVEMLAAPFKSTFIRQLP